MIVGYLHQQSFRRPMSRCFDDGIKADRKSHRLALLRASFPVAGGRRRGLPSEDSVRARKRLAFGRGSRGIVRVAVPMLSRIANFSTDLDPAQGPNPRLKWCLCRPASVLPAGWAGAGGDPRLQVDDRRSVCASAENGWDRESLSTHRKRRRPWSSAFAGGFQMLGRHGWCDSRWHRR